MDDLGSTSSASSSRAAYIDSGASTPSRSSDCASTRFVRHADREPHVLVAALLGGAHHRQSR